MTLPYLLLAAATVALGLAGYFQKAWLAELFAVYYAGVFGLGHIAISEELMPQLVTAALSTLFLLAGAVPAYLIYFRGRTPAPSGSLSAIRGLLFRRYYINALYYSLFVRPTMWLSRHLYSAVEVGFFDRLNVGIAAAARSASSMLRKSHSGDLNYNVLAFAVGLAMLMVIILVAVIW
jgi:NADH-quinone oxidoreductase subunit L